MNDKQNGTNNEKILDNILRNLNMLEKALDRLKRKNWHHESQYPESIILIGLLFSSINSNCGFFGGVPFVPTLRVPPIAAAAILILT